MKKLLMLLVVLVLVLGAAVVIVPGLIPPEVIKAQLIERVKAATGRTMTIDGKLALKAYPFIGVEAEKVTLSNPEGFDDKAFVSVGSLQVNVALMPLLSKNIQVNSFVLKEPVIHLAVNKAGKQNWDFSAPVEKSEEKAPAEVKTASKEAGFSPANLTLSGIEIENGSLSFVDAKAGTQQKLDKLNAKVGLKSINAPLDVKADAMWQGKQVKVALNVNSILSMMEGKSSPFSVAVNSDVIAVDAKGTLEGDNVAAKAKVNSSSLKALAKWLNPKGAAMATPATLALDTSADVACKAKVCSLSQLSFALDDLKATGDAKLNLSGAKPKIGLNVKMGVLDVNPFMQPQKQANLLPLLISDAQAAAGHWSNDPIDLSGLKAVDLDASIDTAGIVFHQFKIGATTLKATLNGGVLTANVPQAALYDGTGNLMLTANAGTSAVGLKAALKGISLAPLLKDAADMERMSGKADIRFNSEGRGRSQADIIASLAGDGSFNVADGKIEKVNLLGLIHNITGAGGAGGTTEFSQLGGSFTIAQGVLTNNDLLIAMKGARVSGQGNINLPAYTLNYRLTPQTFSTKQDATTGETKERAGVEVPVLITGSLENPSFQPDMQSVIKEAITDPKKLRESIKNSSRDVKEIIKDPKEAVKNLKGLLKGF